MKKRMRTLVALTLAVCMLVPSTISAAEIGSVDGQQVEQSERNDQGNAVDLEEEVTVGNGEEENKTLNIVNEVDEKEPEKPAHTGWYQNENGEKYLYNIEGALITGWYLQDNKWYYLDGDNQEHPGIMLNNEIKEINGHYYSFDQNGVMQTGWVLKNEGWYYAQADGSLAMGWLHLNGVWYYLDGNNQEYPGLMFSDQIKNIAGWNFSFDAGGAMQTGWILKPEGWYYAQPNGAFAKGWLYLNNKWYYLDGNDQEHPGLMLSDQIKNIAGWNFCFNAGGAMQTGWILKPEGWYYAQSNGAFAKGWLYLNGVWYYLDENNVEYPDLMVSNQEKPIGGNTYFFDGSGAMKTGWRLKAEGWYYFDPSGARAVGWRRVAGAWYYLDGDNEEYPGLLVTDCSKEIGGTVYYFNTAGAMREGWYVEDGNWYYYDASGSIASGWRYVNGAWYYLNPADDNKMTASGWKVINGSWYYFETSGAMAKNWRAIGGEWYYLGEDGAMKTGWQLVNGRWYYMYCQNDSYGGTWGTMAKSRYIGGYYLGASGAMVPSDMAMMTAKAQAYTSNTNNLILVDRARCRVAIFNGRLGAWNLSQFWQCAPGAASTPTVAGTFTVQSKGYYFDSGSARCYWYTQFYGNYLFHSVLYSKYNGSLMDGRVGIPLSHGCVRLEIQNAKWIYDNIPRGTKVVVY